MRNRERSHVPLSKKEFGAVYRCASGCVHLQIGRTTLGFSKEEYLDFVDLVHQSAANLEVLLQSEIDDGWQRECG